MDARLEWDAIPKKEASPLLEMVTGVLAVAST
jgi:hypothetical protein